MVNTDLERNIRSRRENEQSFGKDKQPNLSKVSLLAFFLKKEKSFQLSRSIAAAITDTQNRLTLLYIKITTKSFELCFFLY